MYINIEIHVNIFKMYIVCIYIYIINIYRAHIYYANKTFIFLYITFK